MPDAVNNITPPGPSFAEPQVEAGVRAGHHAVSGAGGCRGSKAGEGALTGLFRFVSGVYSGGADGGAAPVQSGADARELPSDVPTSGNAAALGSLQDAVSGGASENEAGSQESGKEEKGVVLEPEDGSSAGSQDSVGCGTPVGVLHIAKPVPGKVGGAVEVETGFDKCVLEIQTFVRGGMPGLDRLRNVLPSIFDAYQIRGEERRADVIRACNLVPVVSFLIPKELKEPSWVRNARPRNSGTDQRLWTAPESLA